MKSYVHIYTGDGKGKTTAAFGLALRAAGAGLRVLIVQFLKRGQFSEVAAIESRFPEIDVRQYGTGEFITGTPTVEDVSEAMRGLAETTDAVLSGTYDLVILDEACVVVSIGLLPVKAFVDIIDRRPLHVELVFTGRDAPEELIAHADLITEMLMIRHYHDEGVNARRGIEY